MGFSTNAQTSERKTVGDVDFYIIDNSAGQVKSDMQISQTVFSPTDAMKNGVETKQMLVAPGNDDCASATVLTIGAALSCAQTSNLATTQVGECLINYAGSTERTVWYRITATNDSLVLNMVRTNVSNCKVRNIKTSYLA